MSWQPENPPPIASVEEAVQWVFEQLQQLSKDLQETIALELRTTHQEPIRPREGLIVLADGTDWNPGSGVGLYVYRGGAWRKLTGS